MDTLDSYSTNCGVFLAPAFDVDFECIRRKFKELDFDAGADRLDGWHPLSSLEMGSTFVIMLFLNDKVWPHA